MNQFSSFLDRVARIAALFSEGYYRYGVVLFYGAVSLALYITQSNIPAAIIVFSLIPMFLLFSMLQQQPPRGWMPIWSFYLMGSFFIISVIVIIFAFFFSTNDDRKIARAYEFKNQWETRYQEDYESMDTIIFKNNLEQIKRFQTKEDIMRFINKTIMEDERFQTIIPVYVKFFESWLQCLHESNCYSQGVEGFFKEIMFEFWANYRCWIYALRNKRETGYPANFGRRVELWYEGLSEVSDGRMEIALTHKRPPIQNSLEVCYVL